ncbi:4448_t:CDS:2, partial [Paraglomus occultum]
MDANRREYLRFVLQYGKEHPDATEDQVKEEYLKSKQVPQNRKSRMEHGFSDKEVGYIRSAFNIDYVDNKDIVNRLIAHIDGCLRKYNINRTDYYAPFTAI